MMPTTIAVLDMLQLTRSTIEKIAASTPGTLIPLARYGDVLREQVGDEHPDQQVQHRITDEDIRAAKDVVENE